MLEQFRKPPKFREEPPKQPRATIHAHNAWLKYHAQQSAYYRRKAAYHRAMGDYYDTWAVTICIVGGFVVLVLGLSEAFFI